MSDVIVCPFCNNDIAAPSSWQEVTCDVCKKKLIRWEWKSCAWLPSSAQLMRANDDKSRGKICKTVILDENHATPIDIELDLADKIEKKTVAFIHKYEKSWFLTAEGCCEIFVNGVNIRKHAELSPGDNISALGADMHLTPNHEIRPGKCDFGVKSINLKNISAQLKDKTLSIDEISINAGEFVGILGPSGCGKSSLLEIMVGLRRNAYGEYRVNGNAGNDALRHANFAYVPQDIALHKELTLKQEISCFTQINIPEPVAADYIDRLLRRIQLEDQKSNATGNLSGGQRRRAGIMLELLRNPAILFLDEPTAGLDPKSESVVMKDLKALSQQGRIVVCSTHIMNSIGLFDKVIFLNEYAHLEFFGTPQELLKKYKITDPVELYNISPKKDLPAKNIPSKKVYRKFSMHFRHWGIAWKEVAGYIKRMFWEISKFNFRKLWKSPFFLLLLQPILIAIVLNFTCADKLYDVDKALGFFFALAVFWLGMNNSIREFVKERIPGRCLERLRRVRLGSYVAAKISWMIIICTTQVALFFGTSSICRPSMVAKNTQYSNAEAWFSLDIAGILLLVCITGGFVGLAISALCKEENTAICFLPIIIIPVLFFSQPIIRNEPYENPAIGIKEQKEKDDPDENQLKKYNKIAVSVERIMPCYGPMVAIQKIKELNQQLVLDKGDKKSDDAKDSVKDDLRKQEALSIKFAITQQLIYMMICFMIMCFCQNKREKEWGGR